MSASHTPGPWRYDADDCRIMSDALTNWEGRPASVVDLRGAMGGDDSDADARLIAAAPELLGALEAVTAAMRRYEMDVDADAPPAHREMMRKAYAAIAKARGEA